MRLIFKPCMYQVTDDKHFLKNMSLSGSKGIGTLKGNNFEVTRTTGQKYIVLNCDKRDIFSIMNEIGTTIREFD